MYGPSPVLLWDIQSVLGTESARMRILSHILSEGRILTLPPNWQRDAARTRRRGRATLSKCDQGKVSKTVSELQRKRVVGVELIAVNQARGFHEGILGFSTVCEVGHFAAKNYVSRQESGGGDAGI